MKVNRFLASMKAFKMDEVVLPITPRNIVSITIMAAVGFVAWQWIGQAYKNWSGA